MRMIELEACNATLFISELWQTVSTLVRFPRGVVLFDPCYFPSEIETIGARAAGDGERLLAFTHGDWDHVVAFTEFEDWPTLAHHNVATKTDAAQEKTLREITDLDGKWYVQRDVPRQFPRIDRAITTRTALDIAGETVICVPVPGHTDDSIATVFPKRHLIVAGDLLSALEFPFAYHSIREYRRTLDTVRDLVAEFDLRTLVPGHGPPALSRAEIESRLAHDVEYLDTLVTRTQMSLRQGVRGESLQQQLASLPYRGQPVNPYIASFHRDNVALAEREFAP